MENQTYKITTEQRSELLKQLAQYEMDPVIKGLRQEFINETIKAGLKAVCGRIYPSFSKEAIVNFKRINAVIDAYTRTNYPAIIHIPTYDLKAFGIHD